MEDSKDDVTNAENMDTNKRTVRKGIKTTMEVEEIGSHATRMSVSMVNAIFVVNGDIPRLIVVKERKCSSNREMIRQTLLKRQY